MNINKLGYEPNSLFIEKLNGLRNVNFGTPWDNIGNRRHMPDPYTYSLLSTNMPLQGIAVVASAATMIITQGLTKVTGNTQNTLVKLYTGFRGVFAVYNVDASPHTTAVGGTYAASDGTYEAIPYALATTVVRYKMLLVLSDGSFLYPSY